MQIKRLIEGLPKPARVLAELYEVPDDLREPSLVFALDRLRNMARNEKEAQYWEEMRQHMMYDTPAPSIMMLDMPDVKEMNVKESVYEIVRFFERPVQWIEIKEFLDHFKEFNESYVRTALRRLVDDKELVREFNGTCYLFRLPAKDIVE